MRKFIEPMFPGNTYHVFGKTVGKEIAFTTDGYYHFFLQQYQKYVYPHSKTFAYSLLPDQFHFVLKIDEQVGCEFDSGSLFCSLFGNIINSYTKAFNIEQNRKGNLFVKPFFRYEIHNIERLPEIIRHVHFLPVFHRLSPSPERWKHSSFFPLANRHASLVEGDEIDFLFGTRNKFEAFHSARTFFQMKFPPWDALRAA